MAKFIDLTGRRFERLSVLYRGDDLISNDGRHRTVWICKCDCGKILPVRTECLTSGRTLSCGCLKAEKARNGHLTHGHSQTKLYAVWRGIKTRCYNSNNDAYPRYGGRGITMCEEWKENYNAFEKWAIQSGYKPKLSIDRIDVNGDYTPANCRWTDDKTQCNNRRSNRILTFNGETHNITEWANILGIPAKTLFTRLYSGYSTEKILTYNSK